MKRIYTPLLAIIIILIIISQGFSQTVAISGAVKTNINVKTYEGLLPGRIAPDAVKLEIDNFGDIVDGACIVQKGNLQALVNFDGQLIIPWGKYSFPEGFTAERIYHRSLIPVKDTRSQLEGFVNSSGKVIIPLIYKSVELFDMYGIARVMDTKFNCVYLNADGEMIQLTSGLSNLDPAFVRPNAKLSTTHDRIMFRKSKIIKTKTTIGGTLPYVGFLTDRGKMVVSNDYPDGGVFTEGLAPVQQIDQFQVSKWGFIDKAGKLVIPFTYQIKPGNFHNGLALVQAKTVADFRFAYINKEGVIKIKLGGAERDYYSPLLFDKNSLYSELDQKAGAFMGKYSFWKYKEEIVLVDTTGKFYKVQDFVNDKALQQSVAGIGILALRNTGILFRDLSKPDSNNNLGVMDYAGNILFPASFNRIFPDSYSDYATATIWKTGSEPVSGIVNKQGVFVLIKQNSTTF